ncbi:Phospholipase C [Pseudogymnoascus destructans]|uniref:Phospholipase C n=1 Tax=Pseudogymnoascus destructans TaxID=655981 RepID=A0A177ABH3_9PEZI|nr:Phospholipase C [Pseudogymnoascus destructans]OAF59469.1 Phospholipase C [Pseudogymnoascus destructans]
MDFILAHFEKSKDKYKDDVKLSTMVNSGWQKMDKYYSKSDESPAYAAALLLNPARKWHYIEQFWRPTWQEKVKKSIKKLWEEEYKPELTIPTSIAPATTSTNEFELWLNSIDTPIAVVDEFDYYCKAERVLGYQSAIEWWLEPATKGLRESLQNGSRYALSSGNVLRSRTRVFCGKNHSFGSPE